MDDAAASSHRDILGPVLVAGFMLALGLLFLFAVPESNEQLVTYMLGQLSGFVGAVVAFRFGRNRLNEQATANTGEAFRAIKAAAEAGNPSAPSSAPLPSPAFGQETSR